MWVNGKANTETVYRVGTLCQVKSKGLAFYCFYVRRYHLSQNIPNIAEYLRQDICLISGYLLSLLVVLGIDCNDGGGLIIRFLINIVLPYRNN
jgi:hypothetical protein